MNGMRWVRVGTVLGALGVVIGAFGAHGLTPTPEALKALSPTEREATERRLANYETGVRYHMYHALAIVGVGLVSLRIARPRILDGAAGLFVFGILAFSGSLYGIGVGGPKWLGMIAPLGGVALILGWVALAFGSKADDPNARTT